MTRARRLIPAIVLAATLGGTALAQTPIQPPRAPNMPAPESTIPEKIEPQDPSATGSTRSDAPLSDKLEATDGVIRPPPGIDPGIRCLHQCRTPARRRSFRLREAPAAIRASSPSKAPRK